jgi:nucleotide-binding universal stress UspA family protein
VTFQRIVIGVDGSPGAQRAVQVGAELAAATGARVLAVHVVSNTWLLELGAIQVDTDPLVQNARAHLAGEWTASLRDPGVDYSVELVQGDPGRVLIEYAESHGAGLIVVGASRHSGLRDELIGGTAHHVVNRSILPVLVVPFREKADADRPVPLPG